MVVFVATLVERVSEHLISLLDGLDGLDGVYVAVFLLVLTPFIEGLDDIELLEGLDGLAETELLAGLPPLILPPLESPLLWAKQTVPIKVNAIKKTIFFMLAIFNLLFSTHKYTTYAIEKPEKHNYFSGEIYEI